MTDIVPRDPKSMQPVHTIVDTPSAITGTLTCGHEHTAPPHAGEQLVTCQVCGAVSCVKFARETVLVSRPVSSRFHLRTEP